MNIRSVIKLTKKYGKCPNCGNEKLGNGQGYFTVHNDSLVRYCKCGFKIRVDENDNIIKDRYRVSFKGSDDTSSEVKINIECDSDRLEAVKLEIARMASQFNGSYFYKKINERESKKYSF